MSRATDLFRQRLTRRANTLAPALRKELLRAWETLRRGMSEAEITKLITSGRLEDILSERDIQRALAGLRVELKGGVESAGKTLAKTLPRTAQGAGIAFNVLSPRVVEAIQVLDTRVMTSLTEAVRETVRQAVQDGLRDGLPPKTIARGLREVIGLAPNQQRAVDNFRTALESRDLGALTRQLRDRRFDGTLRKAFAGDGLSTAQIERMTDAYRARFLAFHAETVTRTAALDAQRLGNHLTWADAVDRGDIDGDKLTKRWSGTLDDREREEHLAMEGETVRWDEPYSNGQMVPGESEYNCRCVSIFETAGTVKPGAGAKGIEPDQLRGASSRLQTGQDIGDLAAARPAAPSSMLTDADRLSAAPAPLSQSQEARAVWSELTARERALLKDGGVTVEFVPERPRALAYYDQYGKRIVVGPMSAADRVGTVAHETGHAIDNMLVGGGAPGKWFWSNGSREFTAAVHAELAAARAAGPPAAGKQYAKFLSHVYATKEQRVQEVFADLFATQRTGVAARAGLYSPAELRAIFPRAYDLFLTAFGGP